MTEKHLKYFFIDRSVVFFLLMLFCICAVSAYMQFTSYMNLDAANSLYESKLLFSGGKYFYDFYETTPPMFLYVYFPVVEIIKYFPSANFLVTFFLYFLFITLVSVAICYLLAKKIFNTDVKIKMLLFVLIIAFVFLIEGVNYFGQREHIALIFTLPYFLLVTTRLQKKRVGAWLCSAVGILASIGFAAKPHFCIPFFLAECYLLIYTKRFSILWRIESGIIYSVFILYAISTYLLFPAYFQAIIPFTMRFYYYAISPASFWTVFLETKLLYAYLTILFYFIERKNNPDRVLINSIAVGTLGYILSYISGLVPWDYHMFPAYGFTIFLNALILYAFASQKHHEKSTRIIYIIFATLIYFFDIYSVQPHSYLFISLLVFCICCYLRKIFLEKWLHALSVISLGILIFIFPIITIFIVYDSSVFVRNLQQPIENFLHTHAYKKPVYFLTGILSVEYPTVDYAGAIHVSRFPYLLWVPAFIKAASENKQNRRTAELYGMQIFFTKLLAKDIAEKKPLFILVDTSYYKNSPAFKMRDLDYIQLFSGIPEFKAVWKNYHYFATINEEPNYKFTVYRLNR